MQSGTLIDFVCDQEGFVHGMIVCEDGTIALANYDLIRIPEIDDGRGARH